MDEKLRIRFRKNAAINAKLFIFCIFVYAGFSAESELCLPSED